MKTRQRVGQNKGRKGGKRKEGGERWLPVCDREEAPEYSKADYPYIQTGFIKPNYSIFQGIATFWEFNNETTNTVSQFLGLLLFLLCFLHLHFFVNEDTLFPPTTTEVIEGMVGREEEGGVVGYNDHDHPPHNVFDSLISADFSAKKLCMEVMLVADVVCSSFSLITHMYQANCQKWHDVLAVADWSGTFIVLLTSCICWDMLISTNQIIPEQDYFANFSSLSTSSLFSPSPTSLFASLPSLHIAFVLFLLSLLLFLFSFHATSHTFRFSSVFLLALVMNGPLSLTLLSHSLSRSLLGVFFFSLGGFFFSSHNPEKIIAKKYDLCMSSHTLWHIFYIFGLYFGHSAMCHCFFGCVPWENDVFSFFSSFSFLSFGSVSLYDVISI